MVIIKLIQDVLRKTQQDIANDLGVSRQTISMWYSGYKLSKKNIENISKTYNIPANYIERAQISGNSFSKDEINDIKKFLVNDDSNFKNNCDYVIQKLLNLLYNGHVYRKPNFDDWISKIKYFSRCSLMTIRNLDEIYKIINNKILVIIYTNTKDIYSIIKEYEDLYMKENVSMIICNAEKEKIEVIDFGGESETNN